MALRGLQYPGSHALLLFGGRTGSPRAFRIETKKLWAIFLCFFSIFSIAVLGSLLFFRELEINRKLKEKVLSFELQETLSRTNPPVAETASAAVAQGLSTEVSARMEDLSVECIAKKCSVRTTIVPTATGLATGQIIVVLETEIPRIGLGNANARIRKRFFIYPGSLQKDELDPNLLAKLQQKPFRLSRALQTTTDFEIAQLLRPLAANVYLFAPDRTLLQHERRVIETTE